MIGYCCRTYQVEKIIFKSSYEDNGGIKYSNLNCIKYDQMKLMGLWSITVGHSYPDRRGGRSLSVESRVVIVNVKSRQYTDRPTMSRRRRPLWNVSRNLIDRSWLGCTVVQLSIDSEAIREICTEWTQWTVGYRLGHNSVVSSLVAATRPTGWHVKRYTCFTKKPNHPQNCLDHCSEEMSCHCNILNFKLNTVTFNCYERL